MATFLVCGVIWLLQTDRLSQRLLWRENNGKWAGGPKVSHVAPLINMRVYVRGSVEASVYLYKYIDRYRYRYGHIHASVCVCMWPAFNEHFNQCINNDCSSSACQSPCWTCRSTSRFFNILSDLFGNKQSKRDVGNKLGHDKHRGRSLMWDDCGKWLPPVVHCFGAGSGYW